jgi:hypothetical protein
MPFGGELNVFGSPDHENGNSKKSMIRRGFGLGGVLNITGIETCCRLVCCQAVFIRCKICVPQEFFLSEQSCLPISEFGVFIRRLQDFSEKDRFFGSQL